MQDRNFDDIAEKFSHNIYGTTKGLLRQAIRMAQLGHRVPLCDVSQAMLKRAQAAAKAKEKGVSGNVHFVHCPIQDTAQHLASPVDLILFHVVLEWVADPVAVLQKLWSVLRADGALSLMHLQC